MPSKLQSILLAGVAVGVASSLFNLIPVAGSCFACLAYLAAGVLAVWHYTNNHRLTISGGQGAGLGALAGIAAMVVATGLSYLFSVIGLTLGWREQMLQQFEASDMDPAMQDQIMGYFESPFIWVAMILMGVVIYGIIGAIGGAIGASIFKKGQDPYAEEAGF